MGAKKTKKFILKGTHMSFFFFHLTLSIGIGHDGFVLKVTKIAQINKQADTHSAFHI